MNYEPWRLYGLRAIKTDFSLSAIVYCPSQSVLTRKAAVARPGHSRKYQQRQCENNQNGFTALNWICLPKPKPNTEKKGQRRYELVLATAHRLNRWQLARKDAWDVAKDGRYWVGFMASSKMPVSSLSLWKMIELSPTRSLDKLTVGKKVIKCGQ